MKGQVGYCGVDSNLHVFREMMGLTDEHELMPTHHVSFAGCNLACTFCCVAEWNELPLSHAVMTPDRLARAVAVRRSAGVRTVMILGGEPTVSLYGILGWMSLLAPGTRVAWKTNSYFLPVACEALSGLVDIVVADFKCWNHRCAEKLLDAGDYRDIARASLKAMAAEADIIVRHLILPGHFACCTKPILQWIAREMRGIKVSLRGDYAPPCDGRNAPDSYVAESEHRTVHELAAALGLNIIH